MWLSLKKTQRYFNNRKKPKFHDESSFSKISESLNLNENQEEDII